LETQPLILLLALKLAATQCGINQHGVSPFPQSKASSNNHYVNNGSPSPFMIQLAFDYLAMFVLSSKHAATFLVHFSASFLIGGLALLPPVAVTLAI